MTACGTYWGAPSGMRRHGRFCSRLAWLLCPPSMTPCLCGSFTGAKGLPCMPAPLACSILMQRGRERERESARERDKELLGWSACSCGRVLAKRISYLSHTHRGRGRGRMYAAIRRRLLISAAVVRSHIWLCIQIKYASPVSLDSMHAC